MEARLQALETILPTLATKADVAELRGELTTGLAGTKADLAQLRGELKSGMAEVRGELRSGLAEVRTAIADSRSDAQRWILATVIGLFVGFGGLFLAMSNALKPVATAAAQQPIIINVPSLAAAPAR